MNRMPEYLTPGVYFETVDTSRRAIAGIRTDIAAFIGIAERGPRHAPTPINSWEQFQAAFGGFIPQGYLAYAAKAFFENGGRSCYIVRVAAEAAETETASAAAQPADRSASIVLSTTGFAAGAVVTVRQTLATQTSGAAQPADRASSFVLEVVGFPEDALAKISQAGVTTFRHIKAVEISLNQFIWEAPLDPAYDLTQPIFFETLHQTDHLLKEAGAANLIWENSLEEFYHPGQAIHFETGASAAQADFLDESGHPTLRLEAASPGAWGNQLSVRVARASSAATRTAGVTQPGDRASSIVESITGFSVGTLVKIFQDGKPLTHRIVNGVDPSRRRLAWDAAIEAAYDLNAAADLTHPISFETVEFTLSVYFAGQVREIFSNLSLVVENKSRYVATVINPASHFIRVTDLSSPAPFPARLPDPLAANLKRGRLRLRAGRDGIAALQPQDFTGSFSSERKWGLRLFEDVDEAAIVAIPDILIKPAPLLAKQIQPKLEPDPCLPGEAPLPEAEPPAPSLPERAPSFSLDQVFGVQQELIAHCETQRDRIALLDPPLFSQPSEILELGEIQSWRRRFDSKYAALYSPWVLVYDPLQLAGQVVRAVPPSGHVAGIFARSDFAFGVHKAPANEELRWAQGALEDINAEAQGLLNPMGINCIRTLPGRGLRLYGARTVSSDADWRYVNVRRLMMMIEEAVEESVQWSVFEPNDFYLRQTLVMAISNFLQALWERGMLAGATADEAFFVKCDEENNPSFIADLGQLIVEVGVAPVIPAEFVIFRIGRTQDTLEIDEATRA